MHKYFPFLNWINTYDRTKFTGDLSAGLTVGIMLIPQGMAYAMLAGLPPIYGLYASTIPLIIYALMGTSRQLAVGPVAMVALLISSGVGAMAELGSNEFIALAILLALLVGVIQLAMGIFRLGFLVNFLSHPVIAGFTSAAALIIGFSQMKHVLGMSIPRGKVHETIAHIFQNFGDINLPTTLIAVGAILLLLLLKRVNKRIPAPLIVVALGMAVVYFLGLHQQGVRIIEGVPGGLPSFGIPSIEMDSILTLLPMALTISFVGFMESIAVAKAIQSKHKDYQVDANQELVSLGIANLVGSFFKAFPVTGGFSRTAVNDQAGAKTGMASIISALLIVVTLLFFTKYFYFLPTAILGSIIIVAVIGLIDYKEAIHLWKFDKKDFSVFMVTAIATLFLGIEEGILVGVVLSIALLVYKVSYPHIAELGRVPGSDKYRNVERFENLHTNSDILILRFDAQLYFANASALADYIHKKIAHRPDIKHVVVDFSVVPSMDSSAVHALKDLVTSLHNEERELYLSNVRGPVRDTLSKFNVLRSENSEHFFISNRAAVDAIKYGKVNEFKEYASQTEIN